MFSTIVLGCVAVIDRTMLSTASHGRGAAYAQEGAGRGLWMYRAGGHSAALLISRANTSRMRVVRSMARRLLAQRTAATGASSSARPRRVAIVGGGPSGFYTAHYLLKVRRQRARARGEGRACSLSCPFCLSPWSAVLSLPAEPQCSVCLCVCVCVCVCVCSLHERRP